MPIGDLALKGRHWPSDLFQVPDAGNSGRQDRTLAGKTCLCVARGAQPETTRPENHGLRVLCAGGGRSGFGCLAARDLVKCGLSLQEDTERTQINVLAVQAITSLVLSAMTVPVAGNPAVSCLEQQPRNKPLKALDTRWEQ